MAADSHYILYNYFRSSASYRVRIAMHLKQIEFDYHAVHLLNGGGEQLQNWYEGLNPSRQVPTLVERAGASTEPIVIAQSMAIFDYLDRTHPERPLFPVNKVQRAHCIQFCEIINSGMQPLFNLKTLAELTKMFGATQEQKNEWTKLWIRNGFEALERFAKLHANNFCLGYDVSAADCFLVPQIFAAERFGVTLENYPTLKKIGENCEALPEYRAASPFRQVDTPAELRRD